MSKETIVLKSSDGVSFEVDEAVARQSEVIATAIDDGCVNDGFPIANVTGRILAEVIEYCKKHVVVDGGDSSSVEEDLNKWDAEFMQTDLSTIYDLILAANYLNIKGLLDLTCQAVADIIAACKDPDEIRAKFNIEKDFTPEEEAAVLKENVWAFE